MTSIYIEKAREGRRAALASLNAHHGENPNVVSIFEGVIERRHAVPLFHSARSRGAQVRKIKSQAPVLVLENPIAA